MQIKNLNIKHYSFLLILVVSALFLIFYAAKKVEAQTCGCTASSTSSCGGTCGDGRPKFPVFTGNTCAQYGCTETEYYQCNCREVCTRTQWVCRQVSSSCCEWWVYPYACKRYCPNYDCGNECVSTTWQCDSCSRQVPKNGNGCCYYNNTWACCCNCSTPTPQPTPTPTPPQPTPTPPPANPCSCVVPSGLNITSPASGTTGINPDGLKIDWTFSSWGVDSGNQPSCTNASGNDRFLLYYSKISGDTSDTPPSPPPASPVSIERDARTYTLYNLDGNSSYSFYLVANNGCGTVQSSTNTITTENRPKIDSINVNAVCAADSSGTYWSGRAAANPGISNPVKYSTAVSDPNGANNISYAIMQIDTHAEEPEADYKFLKIMYVQSRTGYTDNTFYVWDNGQWTNTITNGAIEGTNVKLYIGPSASQATQNGANGLNIDWMVEFKNSFAQGKDNVYLYVEDTAGAQDRSTGTVTNIPGGAVGTNWHQLANLPVWGVDTDATFLIQPVPSIVDANTIEVPWSGSDSTSGVRRIDGFCWQNGGSSKNIIKVSPAPTGTIALPTSDPDPANNLSVTSNCLASLTSSATYRYDLPVSTSSISSFSFKARGVDNACNVTSDVQVQNINRPWILTYGNNTHTANMSITLPDVSIDSIFKGSGGTILARTTGEAFASTYIESSTNTDIPLKASRNSYTMTTYNDLNIKPPEKADADNYYDYLYNVVSRNTNLQTIAASAFTGKTSMSSVGAVAQNSAAHYLVQGDLTIGDTTSPRVFNCDTKTIIFVDGNLTIEPDIVATGNDNGCVVIARGNITVTNGDYKNTGNTSINSPSRYDRIDAFIIVHGSFIVQEDIAGTTKKDGLMVKGSVITQGIDLQRSLGQQNNLSGPSEGMVFDPRYILTPEFRNAFSIGGFSVREVGYDR